MRVCYVYPAMLTGLELLSNAKNSRNMLHSNRFQWCALSRLLLYCYRYLLFALNNKPIIWSVTVFSKQLCSQWNLTVQTEQLQDKLQKNLHP